LLTIISNEVTLGVGGMVRKMGGGGGKKEEKGEGGGGGIVFEILLRVAPLGEERREGEK